MNTFDDADVVARRAAKLSGLLALADVPVPAMALPSGLVIRTRPRFPIGWQLAAALALLVAGAAGVTPVRAWIVETVHAVWLKVTGHPAVPEVGPVAAPPAAPLSASGAVSFPVMDPLVIRIRSRQDSGGTVAIQPSGSDQVRAIINGPATAAELVVSPTALSIQNRRDSRASYIIQVPAGVSRVVLQIGNEPERRLTAASEVDLLRR